MWQLLSYHQLTMNIFRIFYPQNWSTAVKNHHPEWNLAQFKGWLLNWHEEFCQFIRSTIDSAAIELDNKYPFYGKYGRLVYTFHDKTYTALYY